MNIFKEPHDMNCEALSEMAWNDPYVLDLKVKMIY